MVDLATGFNAAIGILMALQERARSGKGQFVEATLYESGLMLSHPYATNWFMTGKAPTRIGNAHPNLAPYDQFRTRTKPIFVGVGNNRQFQRFCAEIGRPGARRATRASPTTRDRVANRATSARRDRGHPGGAGRRGGVRAAPRARRAVRRGREHPRRADPSANAARGMIVEQGEYKGVANAIRMSRTPARVRRTPPRFGEANRDVLAEAGYSGAEIDALMAEGVVVAAMRKAPAD